MLTKRESQIVELVARGFGTDTIASALGVKRQTAKGYITKIYDKLDIHTRSGLVAWAWEQGLCE